MTVRATTKTALVTGGANGFGAAVAIALAGRDLNVAIADVDAVAAEAVAARCRSDTTDAAALTYDLGSADGPAAMVTATVARFGRLDVLVNAAAHATIEAFLEMTPAAWERSLLVNVRGMALATAAAGEQMRAQGGGRIVNVTSAASRMALPTYAAYAASKAAVDSLTRTAAVALAPHNIQVNSIGPGMMDTDLQDRTERLMAELEGRDDLDAFKAERTARIPLGRRMTPDEMAEAVCWLALDAPDYITAERLNASGGMDRD